MSAAISADLDMMGSGLGDVQTYPFRQVFSESIGSFTSPQNGTTAGRNRRAILVNKYYSGLVINRPEPLAFCNLDTISATGYDCRTIGFLYLEVEIFLLILRTRCSSLYRLSLSRVCCTSVPPRL